MAFRIAAQQRRTTKLQQRDLAAFGDDNGEDEETPSTSDCAAFGAPAGDGRSGSTAVTTSCPLNTSDAAHETRRLHLRGLPVTEEKKNTK